MQRRLNFRIQRVDFFVCAGFPRSFHCAVFLTEEEERCRGRTFITHRRLGCNKPSGLAAVRCGSRKINEVRARARNKVECPIMMVPYTTLQGMCGVRPQKRTSLQILNQRSQDLESVKYLFMKRPQKGPSQIVDFVFTQKKVRCPWALARSFEQSQVFERTHDFESKL